ncbi:SDR family oxidoreductase [Rhodobacteraceae bacterium CCMM004]|nr:SDR family oxidoreductase [Rhodobacteraceae bacterium CCMM004]
MGKALVTGAGTRLGRAMALYLAGRGIDVAVHYNTSADAAGAVAAEARARGVRAEPLAADLLDWDAAEGLVGRAAAALDGPLTVLVNNASIFEHDAVGTVTRTSWDRHMGANLRAPLQLLQSFAAQVPPAATDAAGEPVARALAVNVVDQRVRKLTPEFVTYTLSKAALWTLTQTAAQALGPAVRVNAIGPGPTLRGAEQTAAQFARQRAATVLGRGADPADIAGALGYFLDAPSVTGQILCVDGGQHLAWRTPDAVGVEGPNGAGDSPT